MRHLTLMCACLLLSACASYDYSQQVKLGQPVISFSGESLDGQPMTIPDDIKGQKTLLLFGFVHDSQFDIDRWLIGLDMTQTDVTIYEIPTIANFFAGLASSFIDDGMREGIPKEMWRIVITVYDDGDRVQRYTGNKKPKNARVLLLDENGNVIHFYDRGFSVAALNDLRKKIDS